VKILTSISLIILIFVGATKDIAVYLDYAMNQDEIINNLCINKDKPIVMCFGQCYIDSQLQENNETQDTPQIQFESKLNYIVDYASMEIEASENETILQVLNPFKSSLYNSPWDDSHFRPPNA